MKCDSYLSSFETTSSFGFSKAVLLLLALGSVLGFFVSLLTGVIVTWREIFIEILINSFAAHPISHWKIQLLGQLLEVMATVGCQYTIVSNVGFF